MSGFILVCQFWSGSGSVISLHFTVYSVLR